MRIDRFVAAASIAIGALGAAAAAAQDGAVEAPASFALRTSVKASALVFRTPDAPELFPERTGADSIWRFRVEPEVRTGTNAIFTLAYEQRLRYTSSASGVATAGVLPSQAAPPFRIHALDWNITESSGASWRHEIDRASVQFHVRRADVTVGRQAIGWGRGVMFGAVDLFAPFSPLEADREWRRGVDAIRTDITLTDRSSVDLVGAFGTGWDTSALAARVRGYAGSIDLEVIGGKRARDVFGAVTTSAAVGDAAVHGEVAMFHVPGDVAIDDATIVWKAVAGASYRFPIGAGILAYAEYHYSGFGAARPEEIVALLSSSRFMDRYLRGDTQILSRHAVAITGSYEASPALAYSGQWLHNPRDRSGVVAPGMTYTLSDAVSLLGTMYVPYGRIPAGRRILSEFGAASLSGLLQLRVYL